MTCRATEEEKRKARQIAPRSATHQRLKLDASTDTPFLVKPFFLCRARTELSSRIVGRALRPPDEYDPVRDER